MLMYVGDIPILLLPHVRIRVSATEKTTRIIHLTNPQLVFMIVTFPPVLNPV